jgi:hypothetical protein
VRFSFFVEYRSHFDRTAFFHDATSTHKIRCCMLQIRWHRLKHPCLDIYWLNLLSLCCEKY